MPCSAERPAWEVALLLARGPLQPEDSFRRALACYGGDLSYIERDIELLDAGLAALELEAQALIVPVTQDARRTTPPARRAA